MNRPRIKRPTSIPRYLVATVGVLVLFAGAMLYDQAHFTRQNVLGIGLMVGGLAVYLLGKQPQKESG